MFLSICIKHYKVDTKDAFSYMKSFVMMIQKKMLFFVWIRENEKIHRLNLYVFYFILKLMKDSINKTMAISARLQIWKILHFQNFDMLSKTHLLICDMYVWISMVSELVVYHISSCT